MGKECPALTPSGNILRISTPRQPRKENPVLELAFLK